MQNGADNRKDRRQRTCPSGRVRPHKCEPRWGRKGQFLRIGAKRDVTSDVIAPGGQVVIDAMAALYRGLLRRAIDRLVYFPGDRG
ncbi:protein of unknown function [Pararobbsia alpina]|jgi:hypothetical protein